jgi:hypothetical protein
MYFCTSSEAHLMGVEIGPIRPPSEAGSLFVRVSRNCPWNRCKFCAIYKGERFSRRPVEDVLREIDLLADGAASLRNGRGAALRGLAPTPADDVALDAAAADMVGRWVSVGARTVFLQDANALSASFDDLLATLLHLKKRMPWVERVTSYARSKSVVKLTLAQLVELKTAGLDRLHVGFESGSDEVLAFMHKGATKAMHLEAGLRIKEAGIELSAYYMPGLGGRNLLKENALETADLVRRVVPDYLRLRSLVIHAGAPLAADVEAGSFVKAGDVETVEEILLFLQNVGDISTRLVSDHAVNLLSGLNGDLATERGAMMSIAEAFLSLEPDLQRLFILGRRLGAFVRMQDMQVPSRRTYVESVWQQIEAAGEDVDAVAGELANRFM